MLNLPLKNNSLSNSPINHQIHSSRESKTIQIPNHINNFLYDVIMPNTLNIQNIRIIKKHKNSLSPQTISKKVTQVKKNRIQKKIQSIVKLNSQQQTKTMSNTPKLKKYTKQNIKKQSKFQENDKYKNYLFSQELSVQTMKLAKYRQTINKDKQNSINGESKLAQSNNLSQDDIQSGDARYMFEVNQKLIDTRKMEEENFQPFKEKVMKVIDKTIKAGKNNNINTLMERVNFYLTSIAETPNKQRYKKITVDAQKSDRKIKSYCQQIQQGIIFRNKSSSKMKKTGFQSRQAKQYRSKSNFMKTRPQTAAMSTRTGSQIKNDHFTTNSRSLSTSQLNRYTISSSEFNLNSKPSAVQNEKNRFSHLLEDIEQTCWQSKINSQILSKKLNKMSNEWNIDENGFRVIEHKRMDMTQRTLDMIRKLRKKSSNIQKVQKQVMQDQ